MNRITRHALLAASLLASPTREQPQPIAPLYDVTFTMPSRYRQADSDTVGCFVIPIAGQTVIERRQTAQVWTSALFGERAVVTEISPHRSRP